MKRATTGNLKSTIIDSIIDSANEYFTMAGLPLSKAPEYFLNVNTAKKIKKAFPSLNCHLEMKVSDLLNLYKIQDVLNEDFLRASGNFDLVLKSKKNSHPRHVIEFKRNLGNRGLKKDARRIGSLCIQEHFRKQLETGFIATISKIPKSGIPGKEKLTTRLDIVHREISHLGNFKVSGLYEILEGNDYGYKNGESLLISVIQIKLIN